MIHSTKKKYLIHSNPDSKEKQRLESVIESKLEIEFELASIRQDQSIADFTVAEKVLKSRAHIQAKQVPSIDILVIVGFGLYAATIMCGPSVISLEKLLDFSQKCYYHSILS